MNQQEKVFEVLKSLGIDYEVITHHAAFTIEDIEELKITQLGDVCKNLFLRDLKGKRYFIVVLNKDKKADIKSLQSQLNSSRLSFASAENLHQLLQLNKGEVTPLAVINDSESIVEVAIDKDLVGRRKLGFHPNVNTATVWISYDSLIKIIEKHGNRIHLINA